MTGLFIFPNKNLIIGSGFCFSSDFQQCGFYLRSAIAGAIMLTRSPRLQRRLMPRAFSSAASDFGDQEFDRIEKSEEQRRPRRNLNCNSFSLDLQPRFWLRWQNWNDFTKIVLALHLISWDLEKKHFSTWMSNWPDGTVQFPWQKSVFWGWIF